MNARTNYVRNIASKSTVSKYFNLVKLWCCDG